MLDTITSISIAKSNTKDSFDKVAFESIDSIKFSAIGNVITEKTWSPINWDFNRRSSRNFRYASFIALDFDTGFPLTETVNVCQTEGLTFLIGTTKSHQVEKTSPSGKVSPAMDRYRLCILTDGPCSDVETYRNTLDYFSLFFPIDESCKDTARYFFPCNSLYAVGSGKLQAWLPVSEEEKQRRIELQKSREADILLNRGTGIIPGWILHEIGRSDHEVGTRHRLCYRIGAEMHKLGFEDEFIGRLVLESGLNAIGGDDVRRAVGNGIKAARGWIGKYEEI